MPAVVRLGDFSFDYFDKDLQLKTKPLKTAKAHNLILDTILSTGILGMLSYFTLLGYYLARPIKSPARGAEAVAILYLAFTFTWFECAQFSHLAWWSLSLWGVINQDI
jgi:O-antigen ligase